MQRPLIKIGVMGSASTSIAAEGLQRVDALARTDDQELVRVHVQQDVEGRHDLVAQAVIERIGVRQRMPSLREHAITRVQERLHLGHPARQAEGPAGRVPREAPLVQRVPGGEVQHLPSVVQDRGGIGAEGAHPGLCRRPHPSGRHADADATGPGGRHCRQHPRRDPVNARANGAVEIQHE